MKAFTSHKTILAIKAAAIIAITQFFITAEPLVMYLSTGGGGAHTGG